MGTKLIVAQANIRAAVVPKTTADAANAAYKESVEIKENIVKAVNAVSTTLGAYSALGSTVPIGGASLQGQNFQRARISADNLLGFIDPSKASSAAPVNTASLNASALNVYKQNLRNLKHALTSTGATGPFTTGATTADFYRELRVQISAAEDRIAMAKGKIGAIQLNIEKASEKIMKEEKKLSEAAKWQAKGGVYSLVNTVKNTSVDKKLNDLVAESNKTISNNVRRLEDTLIELEGNSMFLEQAYNLLKMQEGKAPAAQKMQAVVDFTNGTLLTSKLVDQETVQELSRFFDNVLTTEWAKNELDAVLTTGKTLRSTISESIKKLDAGQGSTQDILALYKQLNGLWIKKSGLPTLQKAKLMKENAQVTDIKSMKALSRKELGIMIVERPQEFIAGVGKSNIDFVKDYMDNKWYDDGYPGRYDFIWKRIEKKISKSYAEYIDSLRKKSGLVPLPP